MRPLAYERAESEEGAVAALAADPDASFIAGGTSLVDLMSTYTETPGRLVDISRIPGLDGIEVREDGLCIGALTRNSDVGAHPTVRERYPALSEALLAGASPQVRNAATVAGNLLQRTRCGYFRNNAAACNKREPGSGCATIEGEHRGLAVLGTSDHCVANHPSDMAVAVADPASPLFGLVEDEVTAEEGRLSWREDAGRGEGYAEVCSHAPARTMSRARVATSPAARLSNSPRRPSERTSSRCGWTRRYARRA